MYSQSVSSSSDNREFLCFRYRPGSILQNADDSCCLYNLNRCYRLSRMDVIACNHRHKIASVEYSVDGGDLESQNEDEDEEIPPFIDIDQPVLTLGRFPDADGDNKTPIGDDIPLRRSLFSNVAPYIAFQSFDCNEPPIMPHEVTKYLKWHLSTITPLIVRRTLINSGFQLMKRCQEWCGTWGKHMKSSCFRTLKESQKINHFPGTFQIGRKDCLWLNLNRMMLKHEVKEFDFIPRTYVLPRDLSCFRQVWKKVGSKAKWIVKPPASARGAGIKVVHRWSQIPRKRAVIVQQYLSRPKLISGAKFDLRLYVLVTSFNPLKVYIYPDGLVRFASVKYNDDINYLSDRFMHLTNYSINKTNSTYTSNDCVDSCTGHKWALRTLWSYLEREQVDVSKLWATVKDIVVKTMIAGETNITPLTRVNTSSRYCCYELFGFDILLDENLKPWLLEVNISPSLQSSSTLDTAIKGPLIKTVFNVAGYQLPNTLPAEEAKKLADKYQFDVVCQDYRLHKTVLSYQERVKQSVYTNLKNREEYLELIIKNLTPDDVRQLIMYEDELTQLDRFEKIFPTAASYPYLQYFDVPRYYNMLFDAWETKYAGNRSEGIMRLEKLCQQKYHLEQPTVC
ncbi:tubulin polyglutamylase TTLL4-like isoform X1 [Frieseomelitta varia]|uniref:tubulin polyglutamylase TTLL4-like isoform X1 n=1 Tax=Frieseomelitta varia TaxID=561572 RepID=UPI001CB6A8D0|nr:tubulin polyglutamylase TTLL4-like isoform X1 [Frieseomelitta varia]